MKKTERFQNIRLDIQTDDFDPARDTLTTIRIELKKLMRIYGGILGANIYLSESKSRKNARKLARMKVGTPGRNYIAEAYSDDWNQALTEVSNQLQTQISSRF